MIILARSDVYNHCQTKKTKESWQRKQKLNLEISRSPSMNGLKSCCSQMMCLNSWASVSRSSMRQLMWFPIQSFWLSRKSLKPNIGLILLPNKSWRGIPYRLFTIKHYSYSVLSWQTFNVFWENVITICYLILFILTWNSVMFVYKGYQSKIRNLA